MRESVQRELNVAKQFKVVAACLKVCAAVFVIMVLFAIILPQLGKPREKARRADCSNNLKQIGLAMQMYANQYGGRFPMDSAHPTLVGSLQLLSNFTHGADIFYCPSNRRDDI